MSGPPDSGPFVDPADVDALLSDFLEPTERSPSTPRLDDRASDVSVVRSSSAEELLDQARAEEERAALTYQAACRAAEHAIAEEDRCARAYRAARAAVERAFARVLDERAKLRDAGGHGNK